MTLALIRLSSMSLRLRHLILAVAVGFSVMSTTLISPVLAEIADAFSISLAAAGATVSAYAFGRLMSRFSGGALADRYGSRPIAMIGSVLVAVGALLAAATTLYWLLLVGRIIQGIGAAMFATSAQGYLLLITPKEELGRGIAKLQTGIVTGAAVGPLIGGVLGEWGDWKTPFYAQVAIGLGLVLVARQGLGGPVGDSRSVRDSLRTGAALFRMPLFVFIGLMGGALFFMRAGGRNALLPLYADRVAGLGPRDIGYVVSASSITAIAITLTAGRLTDSWGRKPVAIVGMLASALTVSAYALTDTFTGMLVVSAVAGLSVTFASVPIATMVGDIAPPGAEGIASGMHRMFVDVGWIIGPLALGGLADRGLWSLGFVLAGVPLLLATIAFSFGPETKTVKSSLT